ncbi:phospholipase D-like domain-containing protein [Sulfuriferula nivalis]|uniref:PLD phosphodiesterase domain-containing protein n=1 Tax=Sulfuriferula nivalis TaxID=2675298 RepID=A0A809S531_9PROT|nr:phospholipase D-like domain-containing protein [Sulfuriferula nivalis]BBP02248.1 hypothetical protein SFSGTM_29560 [Sulfuriferula nivalis]
MIPTQPARSINPIVRPDGSCYTAYATENVWTGVEAYSGVTWGNSVTPYTTGKDYFAQLIVALKGATKSIYIAGWQVNWDAQLAKGVRLFDVLLEVAKKGTVQIYVMPWDDTPPVQTYDDQTKAVLEAINGITGNQCVHVNLAASLADSNAKFYSHHQKQVVIDNQIAFIGGMDLAYGRYDDATYDLHANADGRAVLNRYNGCVAWVGSVTKSEVADPDLLVGMYDTPVNRTATLAAIQKGAMQIPDGATYTTLNPATQPRMPWQDVHLQITGPAVADLVRNFIWRWNSEGGSPSIPLPATPAKQTVNTGCGIQVLRSAPLKMRQAEYKALPFSARPETPIKGAQANIADAMAILIDKAQHFIYIENQFFVSGFGLAGNRESGDLTGPADVVHSNNKYGIEATRVYAMWDIDEPPQNKICEQLATKINAFIMNHKGEPFHVYITLPVHPEGKLNDGSIMTQIHWTMQSLVFGTKSLLNRIRRSFRARDLVDQNGPDSDWKRAYADDNTEYESIDIKRCFEYVTLLNLRNHAQLGDRYVTEQIYVHSKMLIVDDLFAIVGSANINDRSLLGSRDSELAVLVMDSKVDSVNLCGDNKLRPTRGHARQLRMAVWNKLFGITAGGERAATELKDAVESPGAKASWEAIQARAAKNTALYEAAFDFIPRNKTPYNPLNLTNPGAASIWPRWYSTDPAKKTWGNLGLMPFDKAFWTNPQFNAAAAAQLAVTAAQLNEVKGFITLLPIEWTKGENNNLGYPTALVVENKTNANPLQQPTAIAQEDVSFTPTTEGKT